jgi:outer membrane translocation and assembly module TamA
MNASSNWNNGIIGLSVNFDHTQTYNPEKADSAQKFRYKNKFWIYPHLTYSYNNYDKRYYPTKGWKMDFSVKYAHGINIKGGDGSAGNFLSAFAHAESVLSMFKNYLSFYFGFTAATTVTGDYGYMPLAYRSYQGGQSPISGWTTLAFPGVPLTADDGLFLCNATLNIQVKIIKNLYVSLRGGVGQADDHFKDMFMIRNLIYGGNIGISYETPIGPVGISFQSSNRMRFGVFFNVFYWY